MVSRQGELALGWGGFPERDSATDPSSEPPLDEPIPDWLRRLSPEDRRQVACLARERRPLVFLVDARARWNLVRPRLPLAGFDVLDFRDQPDGDFQIVAFSDSQPRESDHVLKCLRQTHPPRAAACQRILWSGSGFAASVLREEATGGGAPSEGPVAEKNS